MTMKNNLPLVYLAGPIFQCNDKQARDWRTLFKGKYKLVIDPMDHDYRGKEQLNVKKIVENDKQSIRDCDVVVTVFKQASVGTSMEIHYAWSLGKKVIVVSKLKKLSPWLVYHSHKVVKTIDQAISIIKTLKANDNYNDKSIIRNQRTINTNPECKHYYGIDKATGFHMMHKIHNASWFNSIEIYERCPKCDEKIN